MSIINQWIGHFLEIGKACEFGTVIGCDRLEHFAKVFAVSFPQLFHCFRDTLGCLVRNRNHQELAALAFKKSEQNMIITDFGSEYQIAFPVSEFFPGFDLCGAFLNAAVQLLLIGTASVLPGSAFELLREVVIPDLEEPEVNIPVKRVGTDNLLSGELFIKKSTPEAGIQRPAVFCKVLEDIV